MLPARLFADRDALWPAVAARVAALRGEGRPVLVGTESVADSEALSRRLAEAGIDHAVLNARHDREEAAIVAGAGQRGAVTVATNMAGRGTDIVLGPGVAALGGLHILCCQLNAARRIDRQLAGRCARQGDPGSVETWLPADAALLQRTRPASLRAFVRRTAPAAADPAVRLFAGLLQRMEERRDRARRRRMLDADERARRSLPFGGPLS